MKEINKGIRTGGNKRRKDFHKKIKPWCQKNLRSGHPWDGHKVYMSGGDNFIEKKPLICNTCGEKVYKLKGEYFDGQLINRCEDCIHLGIFKTIINEKEKNKNNNSKE